MTVDDLNFDRADFTTAAPEDNCAWCTRGLGDKYFDVHDFRVCSVCAEQAREIYPEDTRAAFLRSTLFGSLAAAMTGMAYFALFRLIGGMWMIFVSIGVGYIIGHSMRMGSNGLGGRRYQVMATVLTYIAVIVPSSAVLLSGQHLRVFAYPLLLLTPFLNLALGDVSLGGLEILFAVVGIRWAWTLMAGAPLEMTGPHPILK